MKSLISDEHECYFCHNPNAEEHHIFRGVNRDLSTKYGCTVYLCVHHHRHPQCGVHWTDPNYHYVGEKNDNELKTKCQRAWEEKFGTREDFIRIFGRSWL